MAPIPVESSYMAPEVIASIVAAITALVAVAVGPFLTIRASKTQMLGPMRQAWINSLRDTVAEFSASIHVGPYQVTALLAQDDSIRHTAEAEKHNRVQNTYRLKEKICLLINPKEEDHQELVRLAENAYTAYLSGQDTSVPLLALRKYTQAVLKTEWKVVKE